jgi:ribose 5-phosphate isomerase A
MTGDEQKRAAAEAALEFVEPGMKLGLGTGSTASHFVDFLGEQVRQGLKVECVPTSERTARRARAHGIELITLEEAPVLDLTIDGADELDDRLDLIKGGGGSLVREKIVAASSRRMIVIADASKKVETLGRYPLPVEIVEFGATSTARRIATALDGAGLSARITIRLGDGGTFKTDNGNCIVDCALDRIDRPQRLAALLSDIPGVVGHGLFLGMAHMAILGTPAGVRTLRR